MSARATSLAGAWAVGLSMMIVPAPAHARGQRIARPAVAVARNHRHRQKPDASQRRIVQVWMVVHEQAAQRFVDAVSAPGWPAYRRFVSPLAYSQRFGPTAAQVTAVRAYLKRRGFTRVRASMDDDYISAVPPVHDHRLMLPRSLRRDVLAITAPDSIRVTADDARAAPLSRTARADDPGCSRYWGQKTEAISPPFDGVDDAAVIVCGYSAGQVRAAYGLTAANTGKGETIALVQLGYPDDMLQALTEYARANGLPAPRHGQYRQETVGSGGRACVNEDLEEATLDSEAAYAMAPGADQLMVEGDECNTNDRDAQALFDAMLAPLSGRGTRAAASIETLTYGLNSTERTTPPSQWRIVHAIALRAAAEGVSLLVSSGDDPGIDPPASDPDLTSVGGTTLGIGAHDQRLFETGWSTAFGERAGTSGPWHQGGIAVAAGGGASVVFREPAYQHGVVPTILSDNAHGEARRTVPDIAADADPASGMLFSIIVTHGHGKTFRSTFRQAGTSLSTPLIAGIVADAEQGQPRRFGFLNPLLYSLAGTSAFHDILPLGASDPPTDRALYMSGTTEIDHRFAPGFLVGINDTQGIRGTDQVTAPGYDTMTGLGSPDGSAFIDGLRSGR